MRTAHQGPSDRPDVLDDVPRVKQWMEEVDRTLNEARRLNDAAWDVVFHLKAELYGRLDARLEADETEAVEEPGTADAV